MPRGQPGRRWESLGLLGKEPKQAAANMPRGLYLYGGVGTGKTMLMDLLVNSAPPHFKACTPVLIRLRGMLCMSIAVTQCPAHMLCHRCPRALGGCACCRDETHNPTQLLFIPITPWRTTGNHVSEQPGPIS